MKILQINSSARSAGANSTRLADAVTTRLKAANPGAVVELRDLAAHPHPVRGGKQPRILFATQAGTRPPRFVIFASGFLEAGYRRFLERRLREEFGFEGTPIEVSVRVREKRRAR